MLPLHRTGFAMLKAPELTIALRLPLLTGCIIGCPEFFFTITKGCTLQSPEPSATSPSYRAAMVFSETSTSTMDDLIPCRNLGNKLLRITWRRNCPPNKMAPKLPFVSLARWEAILDHASNRTNFFTFQDKYAWSVS